LLYAVLLYLHIGGAILSIGPFFVLFPMLPLLREAPADRLDSHIRIFRFTVRLAKHAGHVLVAAGLFLVWLRGWSWTTSWIDLTVVIMAGSLYFFARAFSPLLRKLKEPEADRNAIVRRLARATWIYLFLMALMMWFMVAKPVLW